MEKLTMCRICLVEDFRMYLIGTTHLHKMYEILTMMPFNTKDSRPLQVCYICCARLQNCYKLKMRCLQSEKLFSQTLNKKVLKLKGGINKETLSTVQVLHMSFGDVVQPPKLWNQVKMECEDSEAATSDIIIEDASSNAQSQFSNLEEHELINIIKREPDEPTSAPVPETTALATETNRTLSNFNKCEETNNKIEDPKTVTEIVLEDRTLETNILQTHNARDYNILNKFKTSNRLLEHNNVEEEISQSTFGIELKPYSCDSCQKSFNYKHCLVNHTRTHTGEKPYQCDICKKCFSIKCNLDIHIRTHTGEKPYQCEICKKCFSKKYHLDNHIRIHTGDKPYQCDECKKCFIKKYHLVNHIRTHTGEKPYQCNICKKSFTDKNRINRHIRTHIGEKPYQCNVCKKCFIEKSNLVQHIRIHKGETPYQCNVCSRCYAEKFQLDNHIRIHNRRKPYQCNICKKRFLSKCKLNQHIRTHTGEKPYQCHVCKKCFNQKGNRDRHIRTHR